MSNTVSVILGQKFYDDHVARDLPSGTVTKRTKRLVHVELDREAYDDLLSDARYYADPYGPTEGVDGLAAAARAVIRKLEAIEPPAPMWRREIGKHTMVLKEGESVFDPTSTKRHIRGPARIEYRRWEDGGLDITLHDA